MQDPAKRRAFSCHFTAVRVIAIMVGMIGCGGAIAPSSTDEGAAKGASQCPSASVLESGAAIGGACSQEGTYCADLQCDPCVRGCAAASCSGGQWVPAVDTATCTSGVEAGAIGTVDAGTDSMTCTMLDQSGFDQSCTQDPDCVAVSAGTICNTGSCLCAAAAINVSDQARYQDMVMKLVATLQPPPGGCNCPSFGKPRCIDNVCRTCGGASPACPDGG